MTGVRGVAGSGPEVSRPAAPRTSLGRFAVRGEAVSAGGSVAFPRTARPPRNGECNYCGLPSTGIACWAHSDLPGLDPAGVFREFLVDLLVTA